MSSYSLDLLNSCRAFPNDSIQFPSNIPFLDKYNSKISILLSLRSENPLLNISKSLSLLILLDYISISNFLIFETLSSDNISPIFFKSVLFFPISLSPKSKTSLSQSEFLSSFNPVHRPYILNYFPILLLYNYRYISLVLRF